MRQGASCAAKKDLQIMPRKEECALALGMEQKVCSKEGCASNGLNGGVKLFNIKFGIFMSFSQDECICE